MRGGILRMKTVYHILDSRLTAVVLPLCVLKLLSIMSLRLGCFRSGCTRSFDRLRSRWAGALPFASRFVLPLGRPSHHRRFFRGTNTLRQGIVMDSLHVITEIPPARKAATRDSSLAGTEMTEMGILAMAMHTVRFPLMTEETCV